MPRLLLVFLFFLGVGSMPATLAQSGAGIPPRPTPFQFVNDQAQLLSPTDAKTLESGLRRYADNNGIQIVVVTVPTLGGQSAADYGRALGTAWGLGQRDKNNGVVLLLSKQERAVTIQAGSGLRSRITPEVTSRVIGQMTPRFKQGNYFAGLRTGLNSLMYAADPSSAPQPAGTAASAPNSSPQASDQVATSPDELATAAPEPAAALPSAPVAPAEPESSGFGIGTLVLAVVVIGGGLWLVSKLFRRRSAPATGSTPDFLPQQPNQPNGPAGNYGHNGYGNQQGGNQQGPDFLSNRGSGVGGMGGGSGMGSGMGGVLLTGAAAAAGAYMGNRMANRNDDNTPHLSPDAPAQPLDNPAHSNPDAAGGSGAFPFLGGAASEADSAPDYFAPDSGSAEPDYFSGDGSSYDDSSSDDTGGGGFDDTNDNSGSW
ncbi:TPM domain-containing protein [Hymenobacter endophyticus]|uniref:TPM domain-containing protein n=1 Tax=Hymenobacter endophyticus TaxID=3076335 RepID=A0ABU3TGZ9_9BACT|nr:TPM domain-containing protein [Hymenobacter endophyticus]MDU0370641.1 TPM domain-containing protein [Hymenobacter endophyticus]